MSIPTDPGVYLDVPFADYLRIPYPSSSTLKIGRNVSMLHMRRAIDGKLEDKDSRARRFGRAFHCWLLEPDRFREDYTIQKHCMAELTSGPNKGRQCTNWGTRRNGDGSWRCGSHGKGFPEIENMITGSEKRDVQGAAHNLESKPIFNTIRSLGFAEYTVIAEVNGVLVKCRYDYYAFLPDGQRVIVDVKKISVMRGSEGQLRKSIREYGYDLQAALYRAAHRAHFGVDAAFLWLFIEDSEPYEVIPKYLSPAMEIVGQSKAMPTLDLWRQCVEWDRYPGYGDEPEPIDPEGWEADRYGCKSLLV